MGRDSGSGLHSGREVFGRGGGPVGRWGDVPCPVFGREGGPVKGGCVPPSSPLDQETTPRAPTWGSVANNGELGLTFIVASLGVGGLSRLFIRSARPRVVSEQFSVLRVEGDTRESSDAPSPADGDAPESTHTNSCNTNQWTTQWTGLQFGWHFVARLESCNKLPPEPESCTTRIVGGGGVPEGRLAHQSLPRQVQHRLAHLQSRVPAALRVRRGQGASRRGACGCMD